jgi:hypothetical protein
MFGELSNRLAGRAFCETNLSNVASRSAKVQHKYNVVVVVRWECANFDPRDAPT